MEVAGVGFGRAAPFEREVGHGVQRHVGGKAVRVGDALRGFDRAHCDRPFQWHDRQTKSQADSGLIEAHRISGHGVLAARGMSGRAARRPWAYRPSIRAARGACAAVDSVCGSRPFAMPVASAAGLFARATRLGRRGAVRAGSRRRRVSRGEFHRLSRSRATGWARPVRRGRHWRAWRWRCGRPSAPSPGVAGAPDRRRAHGARPCGASYTGTPSAGRHRDERQHRRRDHAEVELGEEPVDRGPYAPSVRRDAVVMQPPCPGVDERPVGEHDLKPEGEIEPRGSVSDASFDGVADDTRPPR